MISTSPSSSAERVSLPPEAPRSASRNVPTRARDDNSRPDEDRRTFAAELKEQAPPAPRERAEKPPRSSEKRRESPAGERTDDARKSDTLQTDDAAQPNLVAPTPPAATPSPSGAPGPAAASTVPQEEAAVTAVTSKEAAAPLAAAVPTAPAQQEARSAAPATPAAIGEEEPVADGASKTSTHQTMLKAPAAGPHAAGDSKEPGAAAIGENGKGAAKPDAAAADERQAKRTPTATEPAGDKKAESHSHAQTPGESAATPNAAAALSSAGQQQPAHAAQAAQTGAGATAAPPVPIHMAPIAIGLQALEGAREFQIRLDPDHLGRVDVKLTIAEDGRVAASLTADRVDTLALLQRDARTLERAFDQAGLTADSNSLSFTLRQDQAGQQGGDRRDAPTPMATIGMPSEKTAAIAPFRQQIAAVRAGGVDIRI
ncbi:MAG: hypothetical protein BGP06_04990 [Rhizobiales bacterium 65-9]|nr:MAG: hypothetical protein BGP06_04990 [Rhizobiales bacterium 65-9]